MRPPLHFALLVAVLMLASACSNFSHQVFVDNQTDRAWMIRIPSEGETDVHDMVHRINPGQRGLAGFWLGSQGHRVQVLTPDCTYVGDFVGGPDGPLRVEGVLNLTARIEPFDAANAGNLEVALVEDCGGYVTR